MDPEDARLAVERHATSKILTPEDLGAIRTLGFRGEALPSIASVSHFVLRTRARGAASGTEIRINGGDVVSVREIGTPEGTCIEVGDLFYNLPARRKFLKSDTAEATQVSRLLTQLALGYPETGWRLTSGSRKLLECPPARSLAERFFQLFGERPDLIELHKEAAGLRIHGYVAALGDHGPVRGPQNVFVNRRIVKDRTIAHAISEAYSVATIKERSPEVHLFIEMPPDRVDVNVHPTKAEVRFLEQSLVHEVLRRGLADTLGRAPAPELQLSPFDVRPGEPRPMTIPGVLAGASIGSRWSPEPYPIDRPIPQATFAVKGDLAAAWEGRRTATDDPSQPGGSLEHEIERAVAMAGGTEDPAAAGIRPMIALGQFRDTYIVAVDDEGIAIIDQHVAHERILFELITGKLTSGRLESQRLLDPDRDRTVAGAARQPRPARAAARALRPRRGGVRWRQRAAVGRSGPPRAGRVRSGRACAGGRPRRGQRRIARRRSAAPDRRDHGVSRGGQSELSPDAWRKCGTSSPSCGARPIRASAPTAVQSCSVSPGGK